MVGNPKKLSIYGGFTIIEALITVSVLAVLAGGTFMMVANVRSGLKKQKLEKDVTKVNSAIQVYLANGGSLEGMTGSFSSSYAWKVSSACRFAPIDCDFPNAAKLPGDASVDTSFDVLLTNEL